MKKLTKCKNFCTSALIFSAISSGLLFSSTAYSASSNTAYTNYVTDSIEIPLRSKPGYKYKIVRMLRTGSSVSIQEVNSKGWAKLIYKYKGRNIEGWMPTSVLQNTPIYKVQFAQQVKKTSRLEKKLNQLKQEQKTLNERFNEASTELKKVKTDNFETEKKLDELTLISGNSIKLDEQNKELSMQVNKLETDNSIMKEQLSQAGDVVQRQWFLTGGGVLLLGLLLGRLFRIPTKKSKWGTL